MTVETDQANERRCNPQGYAGRFERRPEYLFGTLVDQVIDASCIKQRPVKDLHVIEIADVFTGPDEVFIGFGKPNAYLVCPDPEGGYQKFYGKSLRRAPSIIQPTRGIVQSGILIRLKGLPCEAIPRIQAAMVKHHGKKFWTCVNAIMTILHDAGFTSGKKSLTSRYMPFRQLGNLLRDGICYEGKAVKFEVIRTTPANMERFSFQIKMAEYLTMCRHAQRQSTALQWVSDRVTDFKRGFARNILGRKPKKKTVYQAAPALPDGVDYLDDISISLSRASKAGVILRMLWGAHTLFQASQKRVDIEQYLPGILPPFPQKNPSLLTRIKKRILISPPVVWLIRQILAPAFASVGPKSEQEIYDMLVTHSDEQPMKYNIVMTSKTITIASTSVAVKVIDWLLSKHVIVSGYSHDDRFAGEVWKDVDGVIHLNPNSGTFQPSQEQLIKAGQFMKAIFPHVRFVVEDIEGKFRQEIQLAAA